MSQFCRVKRSLYPFHAHKYDTTEVFTKERPSLLQFLEKQTIKNHVNKGSYINFRSKNKSTVRSNRPAQSQIEVNGLGLKFSARTRQQIWNEHINHGPEMAKIICNIANGKENKPGSMNEIHYRPFSKNKTRFCNTQRYESLRSALQQRPNNATQQMNTKKTFLKTNKYKILKTQSRSHLSKFLQKEQKNLTEAQQLHENDINIGEMYTKQRNNEGEIVQLGSINKVIIKQNKQSISNIQELNNQKVKLKTIQPTKYNISFVQDQRNIRQEQPFDVNFSTIKLRNQSSSKFVSQDVIQQLIESTNHPIFQQYQRGHPHKKRKPDIEKIRRKFPQHFFK